MIYLNICIMNKILAVGQVCISKQSAVFPERQCFSSLARWLSVLQSFRLVFFVRAEVFFSSHNIAHLLLPTLSCACACHARYPIMSMSRLCRLRTMPIMYRIRKFLTWFWYMKVQGKDWHLHFLENTFVYLFIKYHSLSFHGPLWSRIESNTYVCV